MENNTEGKKLIAGFMGFPFVTEVTVYEYGMDFKSSFEKEIMYSNIQPVLKTYEETFLGQHVATHNDYFDPEEQNKDFSKTFPNYGKSWDALMPVVELCLERQLFGSQHLIDKIQEAVSNVRLSESVEAVVEFIQWYNKNKISNED